MQQAPVQISRLHLYAPIGSDPMGTLWQAYDVARKCYVVAHEMQGEHAQHPPLMPVGHELVTEAGRVFVILPTAPPSPPLQSQPRPRRSDRVGWLVGGIAGAVALTAVITVGVISSLRAGDDTPAASAASPAAVEPAATDPVNVHIAGIKSGECAIAVSFATDPTTEVEPFQRECDGSDWRSHTVLWVKDDVTRDDAISVAKTEAGNCHGPSGDTDPRLVWSSTDGHTGILVCFN
jgi:hypothetical protein